MIITCIQSFECASWNCNIYQECLHIWFFVYGEITEGTIIEATVQAMMEMIYHLISSHFSSGVSEDAGSEQTAHWGGQLSLYEMSLKKKGTFSLAINDWQEIKLK